MKKLATIWNNSLTIIGVLGLILLILSYFVAYNRYVLMFTQILSTISLAVVFTLTYFILIKRKQFSVSLILLFLGSGGLVFSNINEIFSDTILQKPVVYNIALTIFSLGVVTYINNKLLSDENHKQHQN